MTEVILIAAVLSAAIIALKFDSNHLSAIFKKSPVSNKASLTEERKMFFVSKRK